MPPRAQIVFVATTQEDVTIMTTLFEQTFNATAPDNRRDLINSIKALIGVILALVIAVVLTVFLLHEVNSATNDFLSNLMPTSGNTSHSRSQ